jgi:hypothetical protein
LIVRSSRFRDVISWRCVSLLVIHIRYRQNPIPL